MRCYAYYKSTSDSFTGNIIIMRKNILSLVIAVSSLAVLSACEATPQPDDIGGQFWQRIAVSESLYMRGPKAQQMLNRDISRCVTELRELEQLGSIKDAIPADLEGRILSQEAADMAKWDTPERDKNLFAEHAEYTNFEGCMTTKGWERIEYVPYGVAHMGRRNYIRSHVKYNDQEPYDAGVSRNAPVESSVSRSRDGDFNNLNPYAVERTQ